jgi:DNA-binding PadR family transcriptional regulator
MGLADVRLTTQTLAVLSALLQDPTTPRYGLDLVREVGLKSGTLYPTLARLEEARWLESEWEAIDPRREHRPPRRLYRLTAAGEVAARTAMEEHLAKLGIRSRPLPTALRPRTT